MLKGKKMECPMKVVYIPYWIKAMLERRNMPISDCLDFNKMKDVLSVEEQSIFLGLGAYHLHDPFFGSDGIAKPETSVGLDDSTITEWYHNDALFSIWEKSIAANDQATKALLNKIDLYHYSEISYKEIKARLLSQASFDSSHEKPFITYDLARDVVGVVVYPGYFTAEKYPSFKYDLLVSILKVLYVYNEYASVCKTPYFRKYLETLEAEK